MAGTDRGAEDHVNSMGTGATPRRGDIVALGLFLLLVTGGGIAIGFVTAPGTWYGQLHKPPFNPPDWIFGPVWTVLYACIAVAGWRVWRRDRSGLPMKLWWLQLALNFAWSPVFFAAHAIGTAAIVVVLLLAAILAFVVSTWTRHPASALLFLPYTAWVGFASVLNISIFLLNR